MFLSCEENMLLLAETESWRKEVEGGVGDFASVAEVFGVVFRAS